MANFYGTNMTSIKSAPPSDGTKLDAMLVGSVVRVQVETIILSAAINSDGTSANIYFARLPAASRLLKVEINSSVDLGATNTLAVTDGTTVFGTARVYGNGVTNRSIDYIDAADAGTELTAETDLYLDAGAAALPASGTLKVTTYYATLN